MRPLKGILSVIRTAYDDLFHQNPSLPEDIIHGSTDFHRTGDPNADRYLEEFRNKPTIGPQTEMFSLSRWKVTAPGHTDAPPDDRL